MASRSEQGNYNNTEEYDDGISEILTDFTQKESKVVLFDADTILYYALYRGKDEQGIPLPDFTEDDLEFVQGKLTELVLKALNSVEKYYNILALYIFIRGKNNFRKELYPEYKANRPEKHPLTNKLYEYMKVAHQAIESEGCESEDMVFTLSKKIDHNGIILYVDHDLEEIPSILYNYGKNKWKKVSEKEGLYNLYKKLCLSEPGDGVKTTPGIGIKYFEKHFKIDFTIEQYEEALWNCYKKAWKGDEVKAKEQLELAKNLLMLKDMDKKD